jgi:hypothetical protein
MVGRSTWAAGGRPKRLERRRGGAFSILDWNKRMRQSSFNVRWAVGFPIEVAVARQSVADQGLRLRSASREGRRASRRTEVQSFCMVRTVRLSQAPIRVVLANGKPKLGGPKTETKRAEEAQPSLSNCLHPQLPRRPRAQKET